MHNNNAFQYKRLFSYRRETRATPYVRRNVALRITQTSRVSLRSTLATATFYSATYIVLYTHRCNRLHYRTASEQCLVWHTCNAEVSRRPTCNKQTSSTTNAIGVNWAVIVINKLRPPPTLFMTRHIPPPSHRRGRGQPWRMNTNFQR